MEKPENLFVQLGHRLRYTCGDGLRPGIREDGDTLTAATLGQDRCFATDPLNGSWSAMIEVWRAGAGDGQFHIGLMQAPPPQTLEQRRLVNQPRPWELSVARQANLHVGRNGYVWRGQQQAGKLHSLEPGRRLLIEFDASASRVRLTVSGPGLAAPEGLELDQIPGPLRLLLNTATSQSELLLVTDEAFLPKTISQRPAGVWGRLSTLGHYDARSQTFWPARIAEDGDPTYELRADFAVMGRGRGRSGLGDIVIINTPDHPGESGALDTWLQWDTRNEEVSIFREDALDPSNKTDVLALGIVDRLTQPGEGRLAISFVDPSALLDVPWQTETYSEDTPNPALRGRLRPTVTGTCRAVPLVPIDTANLRYELADDMLLAAPAAVYDRGVRLTPGAGYEMQGSAGATLRRLTNPAGLQCADVSAGLLDIHALIGAVTGDFVYWAGNAPKGWQSAVSGGASLSHTTHGPRLQRAAQGHAELRFANAFDQRGAQYRLDIDLHTHSGAALLVQMAAANGSNRQTVAQLSGAGRHSVVFSESGGRSLLSLRLDAPGTAVIGRVRLARVEAVQKLRAFVAYAACARGGLPPHAISTTLGVLGIPNQARYDFCLATGPEDRRSVREVLNALFDSINAAWWFDRHGQMRAVALQAVEQFTPAFTLSDSNIIGEVRVELDTAPGLSTRVQVEPIWTRHGTSDIADSLNTTAQGRALAASLMADYASISQWFGPLVQAYAHAAAAAPLPSLLADEFAGFYARPVRTRCYRRPRHIYSLTAALSRAHTLTPGNLVALKHNGTTHTLMVIATRGRYASDVVELTLWG